MVTLASLNSIFAHAHAPASFKISLRNLVPAMCAALPVTNVCREAEVLPQSGVIAVSPETRSNCGHGSHQGIGANLRDDRVRSLADIDGALVQGDASVALQSDAHRRRIRQRRVSASVPHAGNANTSAQRPGCTGIKCSSFCPRDLPPRTQRFEARANSHALAENLSSHCRSVVIQRVQNAELQTIDADSIREIIIELFLRDRGLRHAESAKRTRGNDVRMNGARQRAIVRNPIRP